MDVNELDFIKNDTEENQFTYGRQADIERLVNAVKDQDSHLCKLNKMPDGQLTSLYNGEICDIDAPLASTVTARYYKGIGAHKDNMVMKSIKIRQATKEGFIDCEIGGVVDLDYPSSETRRGRVIESGKISPTLTTENIPSVIELGDPEFYNFFYEIDGDIYLIRIRKLIPKECWRLMSFSDEDFRKAEEVNSQTQLYKQAGNSIVKKVLMAIMSQLNIDGVTQWNNLSDEERIDIFGKIKETTTDTKDVQNGNEQIPDGNDT